MLCDCQDEFDLCFYLSAECERIILLHYPVEKFSTSQMLRYVNESVGSEEKESNFFIEIRYCSFLSTVRDTIPCAKFYCFNVYIVLLPSDVCIAILGCAIESFINVFLLVSVSDRLFWPS